MATIKKIQIADLGEVQESAMLRTASRDILVYPTELSLSAGLDQKHLPVFRKDFTMGQSLGLESETYLTCAASMLTSNRPICPQVYQQGAPSIFQLAVPTFSPSPVLKMDEFACLNMNVSVPENASGPLPVMVWIHGGGFAVGSSNENVYDGLSLMQTSVKGGAPVLHVAINYRLGYFGFLASEELKQENGGKAPGNYGLWDQRLALEFIKKHISSFGGDPSLITVFGESAGGVSVHAHLLAGVDVFQQAICQSGVLRTLGPLKVNDPYMEHRYRSLFATLDKSLSQSVESLRTVPVEAIVELTAKQSGGALAAFFVTDDTDCEDSFFPKSTDWVTPYAFCKRLMIGDCAAESMILGPIMGQIPSKDIVRLLTSSRALPSTFLPQFGLSSSDLGDFDHHTQVGMKALTDFQNEITFHGPIEAVIAAAPGISTYVYRFDRENAWPGSLLAGIAHHTIELLYLAGVPLECPTAEAEKDRELSQLLMKHWTDFATRKEPWRGAGKERWEMLYERNGDAREVKRNPGETRNLKLVGEELSENADTMLRISVGLSGGTIL